MSGGTSPAPWARGSLSPELVLVDPRLAERTREQLAVPDDTLDRLERALWATRRAEIEAGPEAPPETVHRAVTASAHRPRSERRRARRMFLVTASTVAVLSAAVLLGVNVNVRGTPAGADSTPVDAVATVQTETESEPAPGDPTPGLMPAGAAPAPRVDERVRTRASSPGAGKTGKNGKNGKTGETAETAPRRFAWAPVAGATGYHVEFFRGNARIQAVDTTRPEYALPATWTYADRRYRLAAGAYRWYVWPVVSGLRQSSATVQAELVVR